MPKRKPTRKRKPTVPTQATEEALTVKCKGCTGCEDKSRCEPFRGKLGSYSGISYTADSWDCALPVRVDAHSACSFNCQYCFSNYLMRDPERKGNYRVGQQSLTELERMFQAGADLDAPNGHFMKALEEVGGPNTPRCPMQWGGLGEPFDHIERQQGWALKAMHIFEKYEQPMRISTKGGEVLLEKEYLRAFNRNPHLYWAAFSIISIDDEMMARLDRNTPLPSTRLKAMKALSELGVKTSLRFRPMIPGVSDCTPNYPHAWKDLLHAAADAGAEALSMEYAFVPGVRPAHIQKMWENIERLCGVPLIRWYEQSTTVFGACLRSSRAWKEDLTHAMREECHKLGMTFAISDPHWKELNDTGCCCGIQPDDPIFGGWQREQATAQLVFSRKAYELGKPRLVTGATQGVPAWADRANIRDMVCITGPRGAFRAKHETWGDKLRATWNDLRSPRGPLNYFEGVLWPVDKDANGNIIYEYRPSARRDQSEGPVPFLHV